MESLKSRLRFIFKIKKSSLEVLEKGNAMMNSSIIYPPMNTWKTE